MVHQRQCLLDQAIGAFAGCRILELDGWQLRLLRLEDLRGNITRFAAIVIEIGRLQELDVTMFLEVSEPQLGRQETDPLAAQAAKKSCGQIEAQFMGAVVWHDDGGPPDGIPVEEPEMDLT